MSKVVNAPIFREKDGLFHPKTEDEIRECVLFAKANGLTIRVLGSGHSEKEAIYTDSKLNHQFEMMDLELDLFNKISFNDEAMQVTTQSGVVMGLPRYKDPDYIPKESVCYQIDQKGWAFSNLGGVSHQTVGGFLSTGSEGGSLKFAFGKTILAIRFVDGNGMIHEVSRTNQPDLFYAVGVSFGVLGIILTVTFQCIPKYVIRGYSKTFSISDSSITRVEGNIISFFQKNDYSRLFWLPQPNVERIQVWCANRMQPTNYDADTGAINLFQRNTYHAIPKVLGSTQSLKSFYLVSFKCSIFSHGNDTPI